MERNPLQLQTFIHNFERNLANAGVRGLNGGTRFRDLPDWTSLQALVVVASFAADYGVSLSDIEFQSADTLQDLYQVVMQGIGQ
jgi:acyl carrier protein